MVKNIIFNEFTMLKSKLYPPIITPIEITEPMMPIAIPSIINGHLINQSVAPTNFIILISLRRVNTVSFMVFDMINIETIIITVIIVAICLALLGVTFVIGIVRFALLYKAYKDEKENYIAVRSVTFVDTVEEENGKLVEPKDKVPLVHVDTVAKDKVVVRVFKKSVPLSDCAGRVNK